MNIPEMIEAKAKKAAQGDWYPANGGTEVPFFTRAGYKLLYCWQPSTGKHAYLNCETDLLIPDDEISNYLGM